MPDLLPQERLQPSLLDRLTDEHPDVQQEGRDKRVLSLSQLRAGVLRDVSWLLNTVHMQATQNLDEYPAVSHSTVNYGIPDLAGKSAAGKNTRALEREVKQALLDFEPRILADGLKVIVHVDPDKLTRHVMSFIIEGKLWAQPLPLNLYLKTDVDLETGAVTVAESR